jgi:hypothetical protein
MRAGMRIARKQKTLNKDNPRDAALGFCSSAGSEQILSEVEGFVFKEGLKNER